MKNIMLMMVLGMAILLEGCGTTQTTASTNAAMEGARVKYSIGGDSGWGSTIGSSNGELVGSQMGVGNF